MKRLAKSDLLIEVIQLYALYLALVLVIYKTPQVFSLIFQVLLLIFFFRSKKSYFWFALVFIAESQPGSLFIIVDPQHSFSLLQNTPLGLLYFWMVFVLVAFVKAFSLKPKHPFFLNNIVITMLIYLCILILAFGVYRLTVFGNVLPWLLIFIIPRLFYDIEDYERFFNLIFSFSFFVLINQIYYLISGSEINMLLGGLSNLSTQVGVTAEYATTALRPVSGISIPFLSIIGSIYFITYKKSRFSKNYLYVILVVSLLSIFLTATRGWILAAAMLTIGFLLVISKNPFSIIPKFLIPTILILTIFNFVPLLKTQSDMVLDRLETLVLFSEGDVTAGGSLSRLDERGPRVMNKFFESPILGNGYGPEGIEFSDGHVGNQNLLMRTGIIGFLLYFILWISFIFKLLFRWKDTPNNSYRNLNLMLVFSLLAILIIHSTSSQWFSYVLGFVRGFIFFFILSFGSYVYWESARKEE